MNILLRIVFFLSLCALAVGAKELPEVPNPPRLVNDFAGVLSQNESIYLEKKLRAYNDSTSSQIAIVIDQSLEGEDVFDYSFRLAEKWGIGQKGKNNGLLIYVALADRKIRIQVGYGLEARITDAYCKRIIEEVIKPNFRAQNYYEGLDEATSILIELASGEFKGSPTKGKRGLTLGSLVAFVVIIIVIIAFFRRMGGGGNGYGSRGLDPWTAFLVGSALGGSSRSSGGWGSFSSGSGSFGGYGGGSFGGGGSGGSW